MSRTTTVRSGRAPGAGGGTRSNMGNPPAVIRPRHPVGIAYDGVNPHAVGSEARSVRRRLGHTSACVPTAPWAVEVAQHRRVRPQASVQGTQGLQNTTHPRFPLA